MVCLAACYSDDGRTSCSDDCGRCGRCCCSGCGSGSRTGRGVVCYSRGNVGAEVDGGVCSCSGIICAAGLGGYWCCWGISNLISLS